MKRIKKTARLFGLIALMLLASVGMSLSGAVPVPPSNKNEKTEENINETDSNDNQSDLAQQ